MDKNMINIDDLLRQRLTGGEEKERPGAWLQMRELLDEKMPEKVAAVYNWRRMLTYAAGLLLLATATVGSYTAYNAFREGDRNSADGNGMTATAMRSAAIDKSNDKSAMVAAADGAALSTKDAGNKMSGSDEIVSTTTATNPETNRNNSANGNASATRNTAYGASVTTKRSKNNRTTLDKLADVSDNAGKLVGTTPRKSLLTGIQFTTAAKLPVSVTTDAPSENGNIPAYDVAMYNSEMPVVNTMPGNMNTNGNVQTAPQSGSNVANNNSGSTPRPKLGPEDTNPRYKKEQKQVDSFRTIAVSESNRRGVRKLDTTVLGKTAVAKYEEMPSDQTADNTDIMPAASLSANAENKDMAPLQNFKTDSKKQYYSKANSLEEVIRNARINLSGVTLRPGLVAGISSTSGSYNMMGVQLGIAGIMTMSEKWSMFAELKFIYRFANGKSMTNQYNQLMDSVLVPGTTQIVYKYEDRTNYYEFATNNSLELPIALRYAINRVNVFAGLNTSYHFAMNPSPREEVYKRELVGESNMSSQLNAEWKKEARISYSDFGSRVNMGALLGVGYQITPAVGVDLRFTQSVWDNVRTRGALQVSKYLYRNPSAQVNFTWRFNSNKYQRPGVR